MTCRRPLQKALGDAAYCNFCGAERGEPCRINEEKGARQITDSVTLAALKIRGIPTPQLDDYEWVLEHFQHGEGWTQKPIDNPLDTGALKTILLQLFVVTRERGEK